MTAYYNEIDPKAAAWLRELIAQGHIAHGEVDERDIRDVTAADLHGFAQCHFFAGIGIWSYALRRAGWPDDRAVWTGSCPCQPFSAAGKGAGFDDERHLWPSWLWLIDQQRPAILLGEQVASKDAEPWLDLVQDDLEGLGYAFGAVAFPSAGIGAPHIRDRTYWVADASGERRDRVASQLRPEASRRIATDHPEAGGCGKAEQLADADDARSQGWIERGDGAEQRPAGTSSVAGGLADASGNGARSERGDNAEAARLPQAERQSGHGSPLSERAGADDDGPGVHRGGGVSGDAGPAGPVNGLWRDADWLFCRDGKWRPVEPGTFPLAHGAPARVGRLRGYGNAINAEAAIAFIEASGVAA